ncbi:protein enabled isoform X3 [Chrysoperla carnea]|uniref:protein enabled isoform X3 n=1 Tax=Chrysoperla carnea TaxID=189513 RepID=UPI001D08714E|nr:protein enabled isoform X3 [Chrysoperla carnea]
MGEHAIASARASVMVYDDVNKKWIPSGSSSGLSKVHIYQHQSQHTFRVVGRKLQDHEVVINCAILKGLKYNQATPTFHQWRDNKQVYGLNFSSREDADAFARAMFHSLEILSNAQNRPLIPNNTQPVYATNGTTYEEDMGYRTMTREDVAIIQERRISSQSMLNSPQGVQASPQSPAGSIGSTGHHRASSAPPAPNPPPLSLAPPPAPPAPPLPPSNHGPPAPPHAAPPTNIVAHNSYSTQCQYAPPAPPPHAPQSGYVSQYATSTIAPPASPAQQPPTSTSVTPSVGVAPPPPPHAPSAQISAGPPPPPPPPMANMSRSTSSDGPDTNSLAAQLQNARLKRNNKQTPPQAPPPVTENSGSSTSSGGSNYGTIGRGGSGGGMASMMDEMAKTLARRRAACEKKDPDPEVDEKKSTWEKTNTLPNNTKFCESPKSTRKRFGSASEETILKVNGLAVDNVNLATFASISPADLENLKHEILKEVKKEINKTKQEIIEAFKSELNRR